jgi:hypothetical protein
VLAQVVVQLFGLLGNLVARLATGHRQRQ